MFVLACLKTLCVPLLDSRVLVAVSEVILLPLVLIYKSFPVYFSDCIMIFLGWVLKILGHLNAEPTGFYYCSVIWPSALVRSVHWLLPLTYILEGMRVRSLPNNYTNRYARRCVVSVMLKPAHLALRAIPWSKSLRSYFFPFEFMWTLTKAPDAFLHEFLHGAASTWLTPWINTCICRGTSESCTCY